MEGIHFTRAGSTAALVHTSHSAFLTHNDRTTRQGFIILGMPNLDARDIRNGIGESHHPSPDWQMTRAEKGSGLPGEQKYHFFDHPVSNFFLGHQG
jgi:hypothetical protein